MNCMHTNVFEHGAVKRSCRACEHFSLVSTETRALQVYALQGATHGIFNDHTL